MFTLRQAFSIYENTQRAMRSKTGKIKRAQQGYYMNSVAPYGYALVDKKLSLHKEDSKKAIQIMKWYGEGKSTQAIREMLLKREIPSPNGNAIWAKGSLDKMVSNTCYNGYTLYKGIRVNNPRLLSVEEYKVIKDRRESIKKTGGMRRRNSQKHFFMLTDKPHYKKKASYKNEGEITNFTSEHTGMLFCQECGGEMTGKSKNFYDDKGEVTKNDLRYTCGDSSRRYRIKNTEGRKRKGSGVEVLKKPCSMTYSLDRDTTEDYIFSVVNEVVKYSKFTREEFKKFVLKRQSQKQGGDKGNKVRLEREVKRWNKDINTFQELTTQSNMDIALKTISPKQHDKNLENYNKHILLLEDKVRKNIDAIVSIKDKNTVADWYDIHKQNMKAREGLKGQQRQSLIETYVERIDVSYDKKEGIHILSIKFVFNMVNDKLIYRDKSDKTKGYDLIEGKDVKLLLIKKKQRIMWESM